MPNFARYLGFFSGRCQTFLAIEVQCSQLLTAVTLALLTTELSKVTWYWRPNWYQSEWIWLKYSKSHCTYHETVCIWLHLFAPPLVFCMFFTLVTTEVIFHLLGTKSHQCFWNRSKRQCTTSWKSVLFPQQCLKNNFVTNCI